jgi:hypothetical protein
VIGESGVAIMNVIQTIDLIATNTVADVAVAKITQMLDADGIADWFDLSLPQVYSALAYYDEHKTEIDQTIEERRRLAADMKEKRVGSRHSPL